MNTTACTNRHPNRSLAQAGIAALVATSMTLGAVAGSGEAFGAPQQGGIGGGDGNQAPQQGGVDQGGQQQGGVTPAPAPAPVPPPSVAGPGGLPAAPAAPQSDWTTTAPSYEGGYNPTPRAITTPNPSAPKVKRIAPKPQTLRLGNFEMANKDIPNFPNKKAYINWANGWAAYSEQQIANTLIVMGMAEEDEASRQAAAIVMGAAGAGAIGGAVAFTTTTIVVGAFAVPIGAGIGWGVGGPVSALGGAAIGAGVAVGAGAVAGAGTAIVAGLIGGAVGWALGAGDKGNDVPRPDGRLPRDAPKGGPDRSAESGPNQFELRLGRDDAARAGLPSVDYIVTARGDVNMTVGATTVKWSAEQAQAPIKALGRLAPAAETAINNGVVAATDIASGVVDGLQVAWPTKAGGPEKRTTGGAHRKQSA